MDESMKMFHYYHIDRNNKMIKYRLVRDMCVIGFVRLIDIGCCCCCSYTNDCHIGCNYNCIGCHYDKGCYHTVCLFHNYHNNYVYHYDNYYTDFDINYYANILS